jgi:RHS repeat-associated protein
MGSVGSTSAAEVGTGTFDYGYNAQGLVTSIGATPLVAPPVDALGRVTTKGDIAIAYGADGHVDHATRGGHVASYVTDEEGHRLAKKVDGAFTAAWIDGDAISPAELVEPLRVAGGKTIGAIRNGRVAIAAADSRGTIESDGDGTSRLASPYGARPTRPDVAFAIDYAGGTYDADLGAESLGVRDYDPAAGRFFEPDPLFLESPDKCVKSPVECSLYGYARSRPLDFVDPKGTEATTTNEQRRAGAEASAWARTQAPSCFSSSCASQIAQQAAKWPFSISPMPYGAYVIAGIEKTVPGKGGASDGKAESLLVAGWDPEIGWHISYVVGGGGGRGDGAGTVLKEYTVWSSSGKKPTETLTVIEGTKGALGAGVWKAKGEPSFGGYVFGATPYSEKAGIEIFGGVGGSITMNPDLGPGMDPHR